ncbi:MAG TPA: AAA family ATPase [Acidimicrobiales bacterium]|nr:AAA family ATPase [Acidimicrobiales bacterium]
MRVALAGKGGAGKTTISATLARLEARRGSAVVAIDADSNPNLGVALGFDPEEANRATSLPFALVSRRIDGPALTSSVASVLEGHALLGPDGVRLVLMGGVGHAEEGCLCSAHATVAALLADIGDTTDSVAVIDLEASPEHLARGTVRNADVLLLVTEPYYRSLEATRRQAELAAGLPISRILVVANKLRSADDAAAVGEFCERHGLEVIAEVPWGDEVGAGDRATLPLIDAAPDGNVVAAVTVLAERLRKLS